MRIVAPPSPVIRMVGREQDGMAIGGVLTMNPSDIASDEALRACIEEDMRDSLDEELEMEP